MYLIICLQMRWKSDYFIKLVFPFLWQFSSNWPHLSPIHSTTSQQSNSSIYIYVYFGSNKSEYRGNLGFSENCGNLVPTLRLAEVCKTKFQIQYTWNRINEKPNWSKIEIESFRGCRRQSAFSNIMYLLICRYIRRVSHMNCCRCTHDYFLTQYC